MPVRVLRGNVKVRFKLMTQCTGKYLKSPIYRGSALWDTLTPEVQRSVTMNVFTKHNIVSLYRQYVDLLG